MMASTFERFRDLIVELAGVDTQQVSLEASLVDDLGLDSLDEIEILIAVEDEFSVSIDDDEVEKIITVSDAVTLIDKARRAAA